MKLQKRVLVLYRTFIQIILMGRLGEIGEMRDVTFSWMDNFQFEIN